MPGSVLFSGQVTALLADESVRVAISHAWKTSSECEREELSTVRSMIRLGGASGAGAVDTTVASARTSTRGLEGTGICSASVRPQSATTLLRQARKASEPFFDKNEAASEESEHYEEGDEVTSAPMVSKRID